MPSIPEYPSWAAAPLTVTLVCDDREAPGCQDRVSIHVTEADAARLYRRRPMGVGKAFMEEWHKQAPGWRWDFPFAPENGKHTRPHERRVICPACQQDIADAYHRPRPPAPEVASGYVARWEGCRSFGYRLGDAPGQGTATERGRWEVIPEAENARREADIKQRLDRVGEILAGAASRRYTGLFGSGRLPDPEAFTAWLVQVGVTFTDFAVSDLSRETVLRIVEVGPVGGWRFKDEVTGEGRPATTEEIAQLVDSVRQRPPMDPPDRPKRRTPRTRKGVAAPPAARDGAGG